MYIKCILLYVEIYILLSVMPLDVFRNDLEMFYTYCL